MPSSRTSCWAGTGRPLSSSGGGAGGTGLPPADCRYVGQGYELTIPLSSVTPPALGRLASVFHAAHRARYGHAAPADPIEVGTHRPAAIGALPHPPAAVTGGAR